MLGKWSSLFAAVMVALVLAGLVLVATNTTHAQAPSANPRITSVSSAIVTGTDRMIWDPTGIGSGDETHPDVAYNSQDDEYLVVFECEDAVGDGRDVVSIIVDSDGQSSYSPNGIATNSSYTDTRPAVAYNPSNNTYLVVWERRSSSSNARDIYRAVLDSSGAISGTEYGIATYAGDQQFPDVAYSPVVSLYLVVWEDHYTTWVNPPDIYGVSLDNSGSVSSYLSITGLDAVGGQARPAVAANGTNGRWMVVWSDSRNSGSTGYDIYGQQMANSGGLYVWRSQIRMADYWSNSDWPDVAWGQVGADHGEFLAVWSDSGVIMGQRIGASGVFAGSEITVSTNRVSGKLLPAVAFDSADETWWVVWQDSREYG